MDKKVRDTLIDVFGLTEAEVNSIEPNADVYDFLRHMVDTTTMRTAQHLIKAAEMESQADEYVQEAARLQELLDVVSIKSSHLSVNGRSALQTLVSAANALDLSTTSPAAVSAKCAHLYLQQSKAQASEALLQKEQERLAAAVQGAEEELRKVQQVLKDVEASVSRRERKMGEQQQHTVSFRSKAAQYDDFLSKMTTKLQPFLERKELLLRNLASRGSEVEFLKERVEEGKLKLADYHALPSSILGAQMAVQEARHRLAASRQRLEQGLVAGWHE